MEKNDTISILYVEDQDDVRLFLSKILSRHYTHVFLAENGKIGLEIYKEHKPDIIISDIKMPVMDGLSMSSRIKEIDPKAKIILTTAHSDMEYFIQSIEIGINQYILKPIDREKLYNAIDNCKEQVLLEREVQNQNQKLKQNHETLVKQERELRENLQKTIALKEIITRSEENLRSVAENIQDAFWLMDDTKIIFVNKAFELLFETPVSKLYDNPEIYKQYIHEDDREKFIKTLSQHLNNRKGSLAAEFRIVTSSGKVKNIWFRDIFIVGDKPNESRRIITLSDISWKIDNERLQQDLLVAERAAMVKQRLLANVSHELRTPLHGIFSMADFLGTTQLTAKQEEYLATIKQSANELMAITSNALNINELDNKEAKIEKKTIESKIFFLPLLERFIADAKNKKLDFNYYFDNHFPDSFVSDPKRLQQILEQFLSNAIKFTHRGKIDANFSAKNAGPNKTEIAITVTDTGIGIKTDYLDKVFQLFSQQEESDNRSYEGLGLGLTLCKKIAQLMGGRIEVESQEKKGSKFTFIVAVEKDEKVFPDNTPIKKQIPDLNLNVLYVEDKEVNQKIISIMLGNAGCTVDIANNGQEALDLYAKNKYDIVLMDIQMPVMDGITATKKLKNLYSNIVPIIGVSANALRADAQYYISEGLDDYISKPVMPNILYQKIWDWTYKKRNQEKDQFNDNSTTRQNTYSLLSDIDFQTLETFKEQTHNDESIINDLYGTFTVEAENLIEKIDNALKHDNNKLLKDSTHALKGLSATIGALKVYHWASEMDKLHKKKVFTQSAHLFGSLKKDYLTVKKIIIESIITS
jgi:PAS domain S-box-containing protein